LTRKQLIKKNINKNKTKQAKKRKNNFKERKTNKAKSQKKKM
jgi:hypothetical protein